MSKIFFVLLLFNFANLVNGQSSISYWNTENGLSNDWISQIIQDQDGYIWVATQYGLNRFDGYEFKAYQYTPNTANSLSANWLRSMTQDSSGLIWVGAYLAGVDAFNPKTGQTTAYKIRGKDGAIVKSIQTIFCDAAQNIWLSSRTGLFVKKANSEQFEPVFDDSVDDFQVNQQGEVYILSNQSIFLLNSQSGKTVRILDFKSAAIQRIYIDRAQDLWAFGKQQLLKITQKGRGWEQEIVLMDELAHSTYFYNSPIFEDSKNQLWLGGDKGIMIIDKTRKKANKHLYKTYFPKGKAIGKALSFFEDQHENIWIGTTKGLILKSPFTKRFEPKQQFPQLEKFTNVREMVAWGNYLFVSNTEGLFRINKYSNEAAIKLIKQPIFSLLLTQDGHIYAGGTDLFRIHPQSLEVVTFPMKNKKGTKNKGPIWSMVEDKSGKIWIGAVGLLQRFNPIKNTFEVFDDDKNPTLHAAPTQDLLIDKKGRLWAASLYNGLYVLEDVAALSDADQATFIQLNYDEMEENSLTTSMVLYLTEGKDGYIWAATDAGLNRIDPIDFRVKRYLKKDGLQDEKIMSLATDDAGFIWGSTIGHGIFRMDSKTDIFTFYNRQDGLVSNNFLLSAVHKNKAGLLFFGSDNEVQLIDPQQMDGIGQPDIDFIFTEIVLSNERKNKLKTNLNEQQKIELVHDFQAFSIHFSTLNYYQPEKTTYHYQLEGVHSEWQSNGNKRSLTFSGLAPGTYTLNVKALNPDLAFKQALISKKIIIHPPWWKTNWAYVGYFLIAIGLIYALYHFLLNRQLEQREALRLIELDNLKNRFFTNITHELRTPLTIILGMAAQLKLFSNKEVQRKAYLIQKDGLQLLDLINQILDLSKLEAGKLPLKKVHGDIIPYLNYLLESFHSIAADKNIRFHFLTEVETLWMDYDQEKIKQIVNNLIANALRFTPNGGDVYLQVDRLDKQAVFKVKDTGKGIAAAQLPKIFDRFYQIEQSNGGTGIGLALVKEMVSLLGGEIKVASKLGKGSTFKVLLPILKEEKIPLALVPKLEMTDLDVGASTIKSANSQKEADLPLILIIEDNLDVRNYLIDCLKRNYRLVGATDGQMGIEKATECIPDLVISDVMMPEKDGYEVCQILKKDIRTSHIPIILLTAKTDATSRIIGLEQGADAYLHKPFSEAELLVRIRKLLELRKQLQARFQSGAFWNKTTIKIATQEDEFVAKVRQIIEENLNDAHFKIPQLCQKLGISRVHLHRKLKALTNQPTSRFIRRIRLQKAKELLKNSTLNISEIAYEVGFADPAYFSRLYSETFGEAPNETRK
jgi:signal transduction histidine kinase/DNA-binding response OmpR family regulator/ligand-binding sensor domain-containing protein